jgi:two-component system chemotaxis sensor kinase CheA
LSGESSLTTYPQTGEKNLSCIVTTIQGKNYVILVKEVLDISIDEVDIEDTAVDRSGILGTVYINNKTISLIDMYGIINNGSNINLVRPLIANDISDASRINKKILVVDDSPMFRKMESDLLKSLGYSVETASHGGEGFEKISKNKYDLLITDVEMPILNGYEFAKKIRTELIGNNIPILALTTRFSEEDKKKGKESGFDFHLEKFKKEEVTKKVLEIVREN